MFEAKNILSQKELEFALENIKSRASEESMQNLLVLIHKNHDNSDKFYEYFMLSREVLLKKLRAAIGKSSLYRMFAYRIDELNSILKIIRPSLFFVERKAIRKGSQILTSYCLNPDCSILDSESFFVLKFNGENGENNDQEKIFGS